VTGAETCAKSSAAASQTGGAFWTIQALRFVAALAVVCVHVTFYTHERLAPSFPMYHQGAHGVRLFFVISGFVMIMSSQRLLSEPKGWAVFAVKRIFRIVPIYWLITFAKLAVVLGASNLVNHSDASDPWFVVKSLFFIPTYNADGEIKPLHAVGWTLNFEMFFYLLFTIALAVRVPPVRFIAPILILLSILSLWRSSDWPAVLQFLCDPINLDFLAGMLIAGWVLRGMTIAPSMAWALVAVGMVGLFAPITWPVMPELVASLVITLLSAATIFGAATLESRVGAQIPPAVLFMGAASYSLYLIHPLISPAAPAIFAKLGIQLPFLAALCSLLIASIGGALCYRFVETPISNVINRRLKGTRLMGASPHVGGPRPDENDSSTGTLASRAN